MPKHLSEYQFKYLTDENNGPRWEHNIEAIHTPTGQSVGRLSWHDGGVIQDVEVTPAHRGKRLSDAMLEHAYLTAMSSGGEIPTPNHAESGELSPEGYKFAKRTWWAGQDNPETGTIDYDIKE